MSLFEAPVMSLFEAPGTKTLLRALLFRAIMRAIMRAMGALIEGYSHMIA